MELEFIRWLRERLPAHPLLKVGPGDDAAVLPLAGRGDVVVTTDLIADGVDFDLRTHEPRRIGHKALAVNLSDLAAMAARPLAVVVAVNLPRGVTRGLDGGVVAAQEGRASPSPGLSLEGEELQNSPPLQGGVRGGSGPVQPSDVQLDLKASPSPGLSLKGEEFSGLELAVELFEGMLPLAEKFHVAIAGGDTNSWDGGLVICITAIGEVTPRGPLLRSGARPGDRIIVTGSFGGSIHGRHLDVEPRVAEALLLNDRYTLHAGIDCSDGLSLDLSRLASASKCGAVIDLDCVPIAEAARLASNDTTKTPIERALSDGEDFELILAVPPKDAEKMLADQPLDGVRLTDVGEFVGEQGLWQRGAGGAKEKLQPRGFEHRF